MLSVFYSKAINHQQYVSLLPHYVTYINGKLSIKVYGYFFTIEVIQTHIVSYLNIK